MFYKVIHRVQDFDYSNTESFIFESDCSDKAIDKFIHKYCIMNKKIKKQYLGISETVQLYTFFPSKEIEQSNDTLILELYKEQQDTEDNYDNTLRHLSITYCHTSYTYKKKCYQLINKYYEEKKEQYKNRKNNI